MKSVRIRYDPEGDILYVTFGKPTTATGYELSDQVLLRIDSDNDEVAGLTLRNYSVHMQAAQALRLSGLEADPEVKDQLLPLLLSAPLNHFLQVREENQEIHATLLSPDLQEAVAG